MRQKSLKQAIGTKNISQGPLLFWNSENLREATRKLNGEQRAKTLVEEDFAPSLGANPIRIVIASINPIRED